MRIEFLVEEPSMEAFLRGGLPRRLAPDSFVIYASQSKDELLKSLESRLRRYARWIAESAHVVVLVDRDNDDCKELLGRLKCAHSGSGLAARRATHRIVIEELEAWYFGDWAAVRKAYPKAPSNIPVKAQFRDPDAIARGTWEAFERVMQRAGYFGGGLPKVQAATRIGPHIDPERSTSRSFQGFCRTLDRLKRV